MKSLLKAVGVIVIVVVLFTVATMVRVVNFDDMKVSYEYEGVEYSCLVYPVSNETPVQLVEQLICFEEIETWYGTDVAPVFYMEDDVYHSM